MYGLKKYTESISYFDKAINLDQKNAEAYNKKGITLNTLNRYNEAIICFDKAIKINPNVIAFHKNKKVALENLFKSTRIQK